jgi:hypothetical protein
MLILVEGAADILVGVTTDVVLATAAVEAAAEASEDDVNPWRESMSEVFMVI